LDEKLNIPTTEVILIFKYFVQLFLSYAVASML